MEIDNALIVYLLAQTGLTALIDGRFFDYIIPQGTKLPAVVIAYISNVKDDIYWGQSTLERPMIQFSAYAPTKAGARAVANQLKLALANYHGTLSGLVVQYIRLENELPTLETNTDGTINCFVHHQEYQVNFTKE